MKYRNFYQKYLLESDTLQSNPSTIFEAPSPFGDGVIVIGQDDRFHCKATDLRGDVQTFVKTLYPGLTDKGAALIALEDNRLSFDGIVKAQDHLNSFRMDEPLLKMAAGKLGVTPGILKKMPIYMDKRGFRYKYIDATSPSGVPLTISTFSPDRELRTTQGVMRLPVSFSERVWLVENPVIASIINEKFGETAISWPKQRELFLYKYKELFEGKHVIALHGDFYFTYEESFYPFLELIRPVVKSHSHIRYGSLCPEQHFATWLMKSENRQRLVSEAEICKNQQPVSRNIYQEYIMQNNTVAIPFAQSSARGYFFYGTKCGKIAQSWPIDLMSVDMAQANYDTRVIMPKRFSEGLRLTTDRVVGINESVRQLTPFNTFKLIRGLINDHIYMEDADMEVLLSLWIMGTYVFTLFPAYPYLHIQANAGSGKTTLLELIKETSFNGVFASRITPGRLMQEISDTQCTLCLDEFEKSSASQSDSPTQILNSGYKRGGSYLKLDGANTDGINLYSPKVYASIDDIRTHSLASRTLSIAMHRKPKHLSLKGWDTSENRLMQRISEIMSGGYTIGLYHHYMIEYLMARLPSQITFPCGVSIDGRNRELIAPLIVMAQMMDLDQGGGSDTTESVLYRALESILFPELEEEMQRLKIFTNQLKEWNQNPEPVIFTYKNGKCWISNKMWDNSRLLMQFENDKKTLMNWLQGQNSEVIRETIHVPGIGTESCTGFPPDLMVNNKTFREWFSPEQAEAAA